MIGQNISHYKIIEKLGEGGMGVVYKAEDTRLKRLVALKFLPSSIMASEAEKTRFIHEAQAAAALDHPNICTIHEIDEADGQLFIAMAYVEGQNLKEKIEAGPLKLDEALGIAMQAAEGLQAAHEKKITHRDIKPANIMLTEKGQVKIMDFGLAKLAGRSALTKEGATLGTVAYMSPEQARGEEVDHRTDIWSFGVVLYEMISGQLPFKGEYDQAVVYLILNVEPEPMIPTGSGRTGVPMELERIVNKAMAKKTGERYQHVDELLVDLKTLGKRLEFGGATERTRVKKSAPFPHAKVKPQSLAMMIGAAILIAGMVAALFMVDWKRSSNLHSNRLVVAVFENQTGDPSLDPIGRMAADWITQGLAQTGLVEIVPSLSALPASDEAGAASETRTAIAFVRALANATGAGKVIFGTYYRQGESIQFQAQIMDAQHEKLLSAITPVSGSLKNPLAAVERLRQNVMGAVATYIDSRIGEGAYIAGHQPPNFEAYQEFIEGMQLFVRREFAEAARHFERAYAFDTTFASPLRVAVDAYGNLGRYAQADSVARILNQSRERLTPLERYFLDSEQASLRGDNTGALWAMRRVVEIAPGWDVGLHVLGYYALRVNRPQETVNALAQYDFERGIMKGWFGSYEVFTQAYHVLGNHRKELEVAQRSRRYYPERFSTLFYETRALAALGRVQEINQRLDESLALPPERGWTAGSVMRLTAGELREHDHRQAAFDVVARAINWYKNRPAEEAATPAHRYALARALYLAERWEEAQALMEKLAAEDSSNIDYQGYLGTIAARRGEPDKARRIAAQLQQLKRPYLFGRHTYWCARIAALLEEREQAVALLREAFAQGQAYGAGVLNDMDLESLRDYPPFKELLRPKG